MDARKTLLAQAFRQAPSRMLVLAPEAPFAVQGGSDWYYAATFTGPEIIGRPMFDVFPDNPAQRSADGVARLAASFERALARRDADFMPLQRYDVRDRRGAFVERYWTPINRPLVAGDGAVVALVHRVEDVTALVQQGEALREAAAQLDGELELRAHHLAVTRALRDEVEQRRRIAAIVAHDLRTPLSTISTGLEVLTIKFRSMETEPPQTVDVVRSAVARMGQLLNDLDDYRVTELRGVLSTSPQWVEVRGLCDEIVRALQVTYQDRTIDLEPGERVGASVDPMRIRQLLTNLLNNALTYGAPDRPVRVGARRVTGGVVLTVTNEGNPIPEGIIPSLFEPFRRGPGTGSGQQRGHMGLGLFIAHQIVQAHGGSISVESTPDRTRFTVFIPVP